MELDLIGKRLGNYQVEQPLGRGGMALVYKAQDVTLKRPVAIKVIAPDLTDQDRYQDRFENEAQSIAALDHPHIVPVYYFGKSKTLYYLAMKFIEGETLEAVIKRYASQGEYLPTADILRLIEGVSAALDYAHSKGVIHRDVKPSNIMLDSNGHPYLNDFGLALNVTQGTLGEIFGTPHYIAPEQATSSSSAVPQSDLYSLGIILYELFTGAVPFDDPSAMAVALKHITEEPPMPRALNPQLAPSIEQVILKALEKQPEARYQSGAKLLTALRSALRSAPKDQPKSPVLPPLPPGKKAPLPRQISNRPVASEVQTMLEQRAKAKPPAPPTPPKIAVPPIAQPKATGEAKAADPKGVVPPVAQPKATGEAKAAAPKGPADPKPKNVPAPIVVAPRSRRKLRPVLLFLLIALIGSVGIFLLQMPNAAPIVLPSLLAGDTQTQVPASVEGESVRFFYNAQSFWWVSETSKSLSTIPIRFVRVDDGTQFEGRRWAKVYQWVDSDNCVRVTAFDASERMERPSSCDRINADIISTANEVFWTSGEFQVYWNDTLVTTCQGGNGECAAVLPTE